MFGAFLNRPVNRYLSIQPELLFQPKGVREEVVGGRRLYLSLDYIEFGILLKARLPMGSRPAPFFILGPAFGYRIACEAKELEGFTTVSVTDCDEAGRAFKRTDFGFVFGPGLGVLVGKSELSLGIRFGVGATDINDSATDAGDGERKNSWVSFCVGFSLPIGQE